MQGIEAMASMSIENFQVFLDSRIAIQRMRRIQEGKEKVVERAQNRVKIFISDFSKFHFFM